MVNKKAVEMAMNTIVIAAIAIIVLIISLYMVSSKLGLFGDELNKCASSGGQCATNGAGIGGSAEEIDAKCPTGKCFRNKCTLLGYVAIKGECSTDKETFIKLDGNYNCCKK